MKVYRTLGALCTVLVVSSVLSLQVQEPDPTLDSHFMEWKMNHEIVYSGAEEEAMRRSIWEENLKKVELHNKEAEQGLHSYTMGMNLFSDRTHEERQKSFGFLPMPQINVGPQMDQHEKNITEGNSTGHQ